ncbi:MAG TPA: hypothetical protein VFZ20_26660 [Longimicrobium sp.]|nr:hypothetical protein [Longimicrobium sp.]
MQTMRRLGAGFSVLVLAACAGEEPPFDAAAATARVGDLLYARNLISDPVVNEKVRGYVAAVDRDGASADSVLREFDRWLAEWSRRHPDRVARARLIPAPPEKGFVQARRPAGGSAVP